MTNNQYINTSISFTRVKMAPFDYFQFVAYGFRKKKATVAF